MDSIIRIAILLLGFSSFLSFAGDRASKSSWPGKYIHVSGQFEMIIDQWDADGLSVDIMKRNDPKAPPYASFVAFIKKRNMAVYRDIREPNSCRVLLMVLTKAIELLGPYQ